MMTVAIMPAETIPAKRRSDRRRCDAGRRELSIRNMRECLFTDYVGRVARRMSHLAVVGRLLDASGRRSQAPAQPSPPPGGAPTRSCGGSSRTGAWADRALRGGGRAPRPRRARPRPRHPAGVRRRPAPGDARPRHRGARRPPRRPPRAARARGAAARGLPARLSRPRARPRRGRGVGASSPRRTRAAAPGSSTPCCGAPPARPRADRGAARGTRRGRRALRHSHPEWIAALWWETLGPDGRPRADGRRQRARRVRAARQHAAHHGGRAGRPAAGASAIRRRDLPEGLVLEAPFDAHGAPEWREGLFMPQSRAAMTVARLLGPLPGERVLDLCAAPGGKTTHLAALMEDRGTLVAVERHRGRAAALARTAAADGRATASRCARATPPRSTSRRPTTACWSTRRARTSARSPAGPTRAGARPPTSPRAWRRTQGAILRAGAAAVRPGGTLVYSTCTISPAENEGVVAAFLADHTAFEADDLREAVPALAASNCAPPPPDAAPPRRHRRLLHRPAAEARRA